MWSFLLVTTFVALASAQHLPGSPYSSYPKHFYKQEETPEITKEKEAALKDGLVHLRERTEFSEQDLEELYKCSRIEARFEAATSKVLELDEELKAVLDIIKSLQNSIDQASQKEDSYEETIRDLTQRLKEAEFRATETESHVSRLQKEILRLEDELFAKELESDDPTIAEELQIRDGIEDN